MSFGGRKDAAGPTHPASCWESQWPLGRNVSSCCFSPGRGGWGDLAIGGAFSGSTWIRLLQCAVGGAAAGRRYCLVTHLNK